MSLRGLLAGSMTDPLTLAFANAIGRSDAPSVAYATADPLTMFLRIVVARMMVLLFGNCRRRLRVWRSGFLGIFLTKVGGVGTGASFQTMSPHALNPRQPMKRETSKAGAPVAKPKPVSRALAVLSESEIYRDHERAFTAGTGLPLRLHAPDMLTVIRHARNEENPFCALMAKTNQSCGQCYALQRRLEEEAQLAPKTMKCFAGLCETAVPVRVGENLIAFLQTGQILLQRPDQAHFNDIAALLLRWGAEVDLKKLEEAYFNTRVLTPKQYEALVQLLNIFAHHLAACSSVLVLDREHAERPEIARARAYIADNCADELSLAKVAKAVNMSANYFSMKFKEATGLNFLEFVTRTRVEKARNLLQNPNRRIGEVAFEVGFQSLSQFNRTFKELTGETPRAYRKSLGSLLR